MSCSISTLLANQQFFAGFAPETIRFLSAHAVRRSIPRDHVLFRRGDPADHFYLLLYGQISIEIPAIQGPYLQVQILTAGEVLGWSWLIPPYTMSFQARAEVTTELLEFDGTLIRAKCEEDAAFGYRLIKHFASLMSERMDAARRKVMDGWNPPGFA